ncbi:MAG: hypothetical protein LBV70_07555 [Candidatus Adiutrix sp.]|jgi:hypothetical protein|nr:hypothetical protein [Candidatus Adiutrix sp.]
MNSSAGRSKLRLLALVSVLALANLILAAAIFGPNLALRLYLERFLPARTGLAVTCRRAEASLLARGLTLDGLTLDGEGLGRLTFGRLEISGLNLLNILTARPGRDLAETLSLTDLHWVREKGTLAADSLRVRRPNRQAAETDPPFQRLDLAGLRVEGPGPPASARFQVNNLEILNSGELQADLGFQVSAAAGLWTGEVRSLALDSVNAVADRWLQGEGRILDLWPELLQLRVDSGRLALDGRPAVLVKTARPEPRFLFTKFSPAAVSRNYFLELSIRPEVLGRTAPFWSDLADLAGGVLDLELSLDLTLDPWERAGQLRNLSLEGRGLGRLDMAFELSGLGPVGNSAAEYLAALAPARLHSLSLAFKDQGFMARYYAWLAKAGGWKEAEVPARLKADFLAPIFQALAKEGGFSNIPAWAEAVGAFLDRPENIMLSAGPARPWPLASLVKTGGYDIIKELGMTLTVNDRPPLRASSD